MNYAPLDPTNAVILFADLQGGIIERTRTNELASLRRAVSALAKLAQLFDIPVIVTTAPAEEGNARVTPEIGAALGDQPQYMRTTTDAFLHAATSNAIARTGRKTLLVAGVATEIIVQHSALSGAARGLDVQVVVDACSTDDQCCERQERDLRAFARRGGHRVVQPAEPLRFKVMPGLDRGALRHPGWSLQSGGGRRGFPTMAAVLPQTRAC